RVPTSGRDNSYGRAEFRCRDLIDPAEDHRAEEDAGEDLPDHRGLMDLLHRLAGGARRDEDQQEGKEEVHGRTAWTRSTRPRLIYALAVGYPDGEFRDVAQGQAACRLQRLGIRRLARRILSERHAEIGLPEALFRRLRQRRGRLLVLPESRARHDEGLVQLHAGRLPVLDEDAAADHAREEAQGRRGEPRLVLYVGEGTAREGRTPRRAAPALDQVRLALG